MTSLPVPLTAEQFDAPHGFFTRQGGVSSGPFASLNCSLSSKDDHGSVLRNRGFAARSIGAEPAKLVGLTQVHGPAVIEVKAPWPPGAGPRADAMVTTNRDIALGIVTADCAPILFADQKAGVVGAAHAGWRGAVAGVIEATVAAMLRLGATSIQAAIGPCIGQNSYEVGEDLRDAVNGIDARHARFFAPGRREAHWQFDLSGYCAARLAGAGVASIAIVNGDTAADEARFFSHRRRTLGEGGPIGHQISIVVLGSG